MTSEQEVSRAKRAKIRDQYRNVYDKFAALFFRHDPIGIAFVNSRLVPENSDEYEPEVDTILPRLQHCSSENDCLKIIHEEFCRWFGADIAGPISNYELIAHEAWIIWNDES